MQFFKNINWDYLKYKNFAFIFSSILIFAGAISLALHGGPNYGIDFTGGRVLEISFEQTPDIGKIRQLLMQNGWNEIEVQSVRDKPWVMFKVPMKLDEQYPDFSEKIIQVMRLHFTTENGYKIEILSNEKVGPKVGQELREKAMWAILLALIAMLIYITARFQFRFGVASVIALFHDAFITIGIFSILNREITLSIVAALMTIVGYSINDSIVVSDRIRENLTKMRRLSTHDLVNKSLNQIFSRTIITSLTTLLVILCLLLFGGTVIYDFALAIFIGVIVGTYSSIYIVSPIVAQWEIWFPKRVGRKTARARL